MTCARWISEVGHRPGDSPTGDISSAKSGGEIFEERGYWSGTVASSSRGGITVEDSSEDPHGSSIWKRTTFADRFPSTEMGIRGLAKLLALQRPAVDSRSKSLRVDVGRWAGVGILPFEDFACRLAETFEVCWFVASASHGRLETESKKAALSQPMVTGSRLSFRLISKACAWRCRTGKGLS